MKRNAFYLALFVVSSVVGFVHANPASAWPTAPKPVWVLSYEDESNVRTYHLSNAGSAAGNFELLDRTENVLVAYPTDVCGPLRKWNTGLFLGTPGKQIALRCIGSLPAGGSRDIVVTYTDPVGASLVTLKARTAN